MNEETQHQENLGKLCRVCGNKIKFNRSYVNAKTVSDYGILLKENYGIFPNEDRLVSVCLSLSINLYTNFFL